MFSGVNTTSKQWLNLCGEPSFLCSFRMKYVLFPAVIKLSMLTSSTVTCNDVMILQYIEKIELHYLLTIVFTLPELYNECKLQN